MNRTKLGLLTLLGLAILVGLSRLLGNGLVLGVNTFTFEFGKVRNNVNLENIINADLQGKDGSFAVYIETMATDSAKMKQKYALNELEPYPAASLYKLVLLAAVLKEIENGNLNYEDNIGGTKTHLKEVFGGIDFGYEEAPESISYSVDEALTRVGRISDNFAAILLTEKLRVLRVSEKSTSSNKLLVQMAKDLGMKDTNFASDPSKTTASDIAAFFRLLYQGQVVSLSASEKIKDYLSLSKINNRIPAGVPEGVKVIHKTGELSRVRHDAGVVFPPNIPYIIVLLSKDLKYEDEGVEVLAQISRDVYEYFSK